MIQLHSSQNQQQLMRYKNLLNIDFHFIKYDTPLYLLHTLLSRQQLAYLDFLSSKMAVREAEAAAMNPVVE